MIKISYNQEVDALYIRLSVNLQECRTVRLTDEITLNIGANEQLVGIEILDAQEIIGQGALPSVELENIALARA